MMKSHEFREQVLESICTEGCKSVNHLLVSTASQVKHSSLQQLNKVDQNWVLVELSSIMKVYENSGSCTI